MTASAVATTSAMEPTAATVEPTAATAVEASCIAAPKAAATMKPVAATEASPIESSAAVEALVPAEPITPVPSASATKSTATVVPASSSIESSTTVAAPSTAVVTTPSATVVAMEPRPRAYEYAAFKIIWAVVAIRSARVGRIVIVTICAYWRRPNVGWTKLNCDLCMGSACPCHHHKKPHQNSVL
jgi:hypothetical protein